mgnify:CR=1 FL=1
MPLGGDFHVEPMAKKTAYRNRWPGYHLRKHVARLKKRDPSWLGRMWVRRTLTAHRPLWLQLEETSPLRHWSAALKNAHDHA